MAEISRTLGRPFTFNLQQIQSLGDHYREVIRLSEEANRSGSQLHPQITPRSVGVLFSLAANSLLDDLPAYQPLKDRDLDGRLAGLRDPEVRAQLVEQGAGLSVDTYRRMYLMPADAPASYSYTDDDSITGIAARRGVTPIEAYIDAMVDSDGRAIVNWPVMNQDEAAIEEMLTSPVTLIGLADAGAHATQIMDASQPTYILSHWVRDRQAISLEAAVKKISHDTASFVGYTDRGRVAEGAFADLNVIDLDAVSLPLPEIVHDFPGDVPRFIQKANGIEHTVVNGVPFMEGGQHTGELAGRLLRST